MEERLLAILRLALKYTASDIHFNVRYNQVSIEMRVNNDNIRIKNKIGDEKLIRYLQYLANLDVGNMLTPQTGQFEIDVDGTLLSLRFAVINEVNMTDAVLRILNSKLNITIDTLSKENAVNNYFKSLLKNDYGLILFSGPTGSGKTTTLYTLLESARHKSIYTIEDPIEVYNKNFIQLQVNETIGLDYENCIKQVLRHHPDIIMIGEIRDAAAAKYAVRASNTGHLVFATIHSSTSYSSISRMLGFGIDKNEFFDMLICLVNQRIYLDSNNRKTVIYEIMDRKEIEYYRENGKNSREFKSIGAKYNEYIEKGYLKKET